MTQMHWNRYLQRQHAKLASPAADWRWLAACRDHEVQVFFDDGLSAAARQRTATAKAICAGCAVRTDCLDFALESRQDDGVWGGLDADERRGLLRSRRRQAREELGDRR